MTEHSSAYGGLGRDLKAITTASGKPMASASIAVGVSSQRYLQFLVHAITSSRTVRPGGRPKCREEARAIRDDYSGLARRADDFHDAIGL